MENISTVFVAIRSIWDNLFGLTYPGIGLTFKGIILGAFIFGFAVYVLKEVLGVGANVITSTGKSKEAKTRAKTAKSKSSTIPTHIGYTTGTAPNRSEGFQDLYTRTK